MLRENGANKEYLGKQQKLNKMIAGLQGSFWDRFVIEE